MTALQAVLVQAAPPLISARTYLAFLKQAGLAPFNLTEPVMENLIRFQISCLCYRTFSSALLLTLQEKSTFELWYLYLILMSP